MSYITIKRNGDSVLLPFYLDHAIKSTEGGTVVVDSHALEDQMDAHLGWKLRKVKLGGGTTEQVEICKRYLRRFSRSLIDEYWASKVSEANFKSHNKPVCMRYETTIDLINHLNIIYQLMYFHYFLGKKESLRDSFPNSCCGISSRNLTAALWEAGIVAAVSTYNTSFDHAYVIVPFEISATNHTGVILADPTSDQLHRNSSEKVRNYLSVLPPEGWKYQTDWAMGEDLYPVIVQVSSCYGTTERNYSEYIKNALNRPAVVV